jgi:hypothetical protein
MSRPVWEVMVDYVADHGNIGFKQDALRLRRLAAGERVRALLRIFVSDVKAGARRVGGGWG